MPTRALALIGAAVLALSACGTDLLGGSDAEGSDSDTVDPVVAAVREAPNAIATAVGSSIEVFESPDGEVQQIVRAEDVLTAPETTPLVFLVKAGTEGWYEVYLPVRPNGSTGWVREDDVTMSGTEFSVEVSLVDFTLKVFDGAEEVMSTDIAIGREDRPTPGGVYYIRELLQPPDPNGVYGPYAYGLSGFSPVLDEFNGGDATIGVHGTNEPDLIGEYVSSGCIRMANATIIRLVTEVGLPLGTPIRISEEAAPLTS